MLLIFRDAQQKILYTGQKDGKILKWDLLKVIYIHKLFFKILVKVENNLFFIHKIFSFL